MIWSDFIFSSFTYPGETGVESLGSASELNPVEVHPPKTSDLPASVEGFVRGIRENQSKWLGLRNCSPTVAFEIIRPDPGDLRFQFVVPTQRLERKVRTQLPVEVPGVEFADGLDGIPIRGNESVGGGLLSLGRPDWFPIQTDFDQPPVNALVSMLHQHSMRDTRFVVQILFRPVSGQPFRRWYWRKQGYRRRDYLRRENQKLWKTVKPTRRDRDQAKAIDTKIGSSRFWTSIRVLVIGAEQHTRSRVKEVSAGFNIFENSETGQYFDISSVEVIRESRLVDFAKAVACREFRGWSLRFQLSVRELAGLVSIPDKQQKNIRFSEK